MTENRFAPAQSIQDVFPHEEHDFTPWLSANLHWLGEPLKLNLSHTGTEMRSPSGMELDILAREVTRDVPVAIECQYGGSDDDHLSRLLVYAAEFDSEIVIWIAEWFQDKHVKAIQWLNHTARSAVEFHAVKIVDYGRIGLEPIAGFKPYVGPQHLGLPKIPIRPPSEGLTNRAKLKRFFEPVKQNLSAAGFAGRGRDLVGDGTDRAFPLSHNGTSLGGVWYCADVRRVAPGPDLYERVQAYLYIDAKECMHERHLHEALTEAIVEIQHDLTARDVTASFHTYSWKSPRGDQRHSIGLKRRTHFDDEESWAVDQAWLVESLRRVREVLQPHVARAMEDFTP